MQEQRTFRISVNLCQFFNDHRSFCRIYVSEKMKTIGDLKNHISNIFHINNYHLICNKEFLPDMEDVRILHRDDMIHLISDKTKDDCEVIEAITTTVREEPEIAIKKRKKKKRKIEEEIVEEKIKKSKKRVTEFNPTFSSSLQLQSTPTSMHLNTFFNKDEPDLIKKINYFEMLQNNETPIHSKSTDNIKNKLHDMIVTHVSKATSLCESANAMTNIKFNSECKKIVKPIEKLDRKINIVKNIVTISQPNLEENGNENVSEAIVDNGDENNHKPVIICQQNIVIKKSLEMEKHDLTEISPNVTDSLANVTKCQINVTDCQMNVTKCQNDVNNYEMNVTECQPNSQMSLIVNQSQPNKNQINVTGCQDIVFENQNNIPECQNNASKCQNNVSECQNVNENQNNVSYAPKISNNTPQPNNETIPSSDMEITHLNSNFDYQTPCSTRNKMLSGVGPLIESMKSEAESSMDSTHNITKRIRKRVRKRKTKSSSNESSIILIESEYKPPNIKAKPLSHIKFDDDLEDTIMIIDDSNTSVDKIVELGQESRSDVTSEILNSSISEEAALKCPVMDKLLPREGDFIIFKILKIAEDYTPQLSKFITGKVEQFVNGEVTMYITDGIEEFQPPQGKFAVDDAELNYVQVLVWQDLVEPRILFP